MKFEQLAQQSCARVLVDSRHDILRAYAGDRVSDLLTHADDGTLLVSNLPGEQLLRLAELMDLPGLCVVDGQALDAGIIAAAAAHGTGLMVSSVGMFETCGRLFECLQRVRSGS